MLCRGLASNVASVCRGLRATEHSPVPFLLIGIFPVPDKYYVLVVNLIIFLSVKRQGNAKEIFTYFHFRQMALYVTSAFAFVILKNQMMTSAKEKKPCIRRKTATIESQYNEFHYRISNETIIPIFSIRG